MLLPEDGSRFLLNVGTCIQNYKTLHSASPYFKCNFTFQLLIEDSKIVDAVPEAEIV